MHIGVFFPFFFQYKINAYPYSFDFPLHALLTAELNGEKSDSMLLVPCLSAGQHLMVHR